MASNSRITEAFSSIGDKISEQQWFQELKGKWDELDPQSRTYLQIAAAGVTLLGTLFIVFSFIWSVHKLKNDVADKSDLLSMLQNANEELRRLKESNTAASAAASTDPWPNYLESTAANAGIVKPGIAVSDPKPGSSGETTKETLFDLNLKHVTIRQVIRYAQALESGSRPVKLRNLVIDTKADPTGYMDATLSISAFALAQAK